MELEDELTGFSTFGYTGTGSPNRADALIWALAELFPGLTKSGKREEEPETIVAEIVEEASEVPKELPSNPISFLQSMMWSDEIADAHIIHFLVAKKVKGITKDSKLADKDGNPLIPDAIINRLIEKWDDVKSFKPIL
jgi:hypothetical protein